MIYRLTYRTQIKESQTDAINGYLALQTEMLKYLIQSGSLITISLFQWEDNLFLYYECKDNVITPSEIFKQSADFLQEWSGADEKRYWVQMYDIFHYDKPITDEYWQRKIPVQNATGRIARLKPEMLSSYIFYHFQYQEEKPCDGGKTGIITLHENLMFFYMEEPGIKETPTYQGLLKTSNTPPNWGEVMNPHFIMWDDSPKDEEIWKNIKLVLWVSANA